METTRTEFRKNIERMIRFSNGYYYIGDYQPATETGRYSTREAAIESQMVRYDIAKEKESGGWNQ